MTPALSPAWRRRRLRRADEATVARLSAAMAARDARSIHALAHRAVSLVVDSGGQMQTASVPLTGRAAASGELVSLVTPGTTLAVAAINGAPGIVLHRGGVVVAVVTTEIRRRRIVNVWVVCNPEKLRHWNR
jgi:RNA polymerase sigma-70 factor (ECF subfamily)